MCHHICLPIYLHHFETLKKFCDAGRFFLQINKRGPVKKLICKKSTHKAENFFPSQGLFNSDDIAFAGINLHCYVHLLAAGLNARKSCLLES